MDATKKTGGEGGKEFKLNEVDKVVIEIIGKESPLITGLGAKDAMEEKENMLHNVESPKNKETENEVMPEKATDPTVGEQRIWTALSSKQYVDTGVLQVLSLDFKSLSTYCNNNESILCIFSAKRVITKNSREHAIFGEESTLKI